MVHPRYMTQGVINLCNVIRLTVSITWCTHRSLIWDHLGGSPGLVVMGGDSCSKGDGFESQGCILVEYLSHLFVEKLQSLFEKTKINEKEAGDGPFFARTSLYLGTSQWSNGVNPTLSYGSVTLKPVRLIEYRFSAYKIALKSFTDWKALGRYLLLITSLEKFNDRPFE